MSYMRTSLGTSVDKLSLPTAPPRGFISGGSERFKGRRVAAIVNGKQHSTATVDQEGDWNIPHWLPAGTYRVRIQTIDDGPSLSSQEYDFAVEQDQVDPSAPRRLPEILIEGRPPQKSGSNVGMWVAVAAVALAAVGGLVWYSKRRSIS